MALTVQQSWTLSTASTAGTAVNCFGTTQENMFYFHSPAGSSASTVAMQTSRLEAGPWVDLTVSTICSVASKMDVKQVTGPLLWVRPRVKGVTGTIIVEMVSVDAL